MYFLFKMGIFHCYVCLPEGNSMFFLKIILGVSFKGLFNYPISIPTKNFGINNFIFFCFGYSNWFLCFFFRRNGCVWVSWVWWIQHRFPLFLSVFLLWEANPSKRTWVKPLRIRELKMSAKKITGFGWKRWGSEISTWLIISPFRIPMVYVHRDAVMYTLLYMNY